MSLHAHAHAPGPGPGSGPGFAPEPDLALIERWRAGEPGAAEALLERYVVSLYRFFQHRCDGDPGELVQATLVGCLQAREQFRGEASFRTYLFTIARHELYRYLRERRRDLRLESGAAVPAAAPITTPRSAIAREQAQRALRDALGELPLEQQLVLELHYWEGLDTVELGQVFEAPPATIRTWLFRARGRLRELLAAHAPDPDR